MNFNTGEKPPKYKMTTQQGKIINFHYFDTAIEMMNLIRPLYGKPFAIKVEDNK